MINYVKKIWGSEEWLVNNETYCSKFLNIDRGYECSVHYHLIKDETFYVLAGEVELYILPREYIVHGSEELINLPNEKGNMQVHKIKDLKPGTIESHLKKIIVRGGEQYRITPLVAHKFRSHTFAAKILEVSTTHYEDDSYRLTTSRKLEPGEY